MIIVRIWEGLGNQLFQYAFARAIELETKKKVRLDTKKIFEDYYNSGSIQRDYGLHNFRIKMKEVSKNDIRPYFFLKQHNKIEKSIFWLATHHLWMFRFFEERRENFSPEFRFFLGNYYFKGWFQNQKYFKKYRNLLLKEIKLRKKIKISNELFSLLGEEETVSVHIRRGDFIKIGIVLPKQYYINAFEQIEKTFENPKYLIFSDDLEWVKKNLEIDREFYYVNRDGKLRDYEELMIMSRCKHNIIANSTFSWWGAWLNQNADKQVIAPKRWFLRADAKDDVCIIPEDWIRI